VLAEVPNSPVSAAQPHRRAPRRALARCVVVHLWRLQLRDAGLRGPEAIAYVLKVLVLLSRLCRYEIDGLLLASIVDAEIQVLVPQLHVLVTELLDDRGAFVSLRFDGGCW